jgi:broad specificity phosphatase PhoE
MRATFIRHAQSTANTGIPCNDLSLVELTDLGWEQATQLAEDWTETPALIVTSPYLRTQQTAKPTIERFSSVPIEVWPIQEFTFLEPSRWNGTSEIERRPCVAAYWKNCDPTSCDGPGAESFGALLRRAEEALVRLSNQPIDGQVLVFSHAQFMQAVGIVVRYPDATDQKRMEHFCRAMPVRNAGLIELGQNCGSWQIEL